MEKVDYAVADESIMNLQESDVAEDSDIAVSSEDEVDDGDAEVSSFTDQHEPRAKAVFREDADEQPENDVEYEDDNENEEENVAYDEGEEETAEVDDPDVVESLVNQEKLSVQEEETHKDLETKSDIIEEKAEEPEKVTPKDESQGSKYNLKSCKQNPIEEGQKSPEKPSEEPTAEDKQITSEAQPPTESQVPVSSNDRDKPADVEKAADDAEGEEEGRIDYGDEDQV